MNRSGTNARAGDSDLLPVFAIIIAFTVSLGVTAAMLPMRLDEILQIAALEFHSRSSLLTSIAQTPGGAPLNYLFQSAVLKIAGNSPIAARLVSVLFSIGALLAFWRLAGRCSIPWPRVSLCLFAVLPVHFMIAGTARPYEQALFFLLLYTIWFLRVSSTPTLTSATLYSIFLVLCIYSEPFAFLPGVGYLLFDLRFVNRKQQRRAFWFLLPATITPLLLFLPYYLWAAHQTNRNWIYAHIPSGSIYVQALQTLAPDGKIGYLIAVLLLLGTAGALLRSFRLSAEPAPGVAGLFSLAGGVVTTLIFVLLLDTIDRSPVWPAHLLWIAPASIILFFATLGWAIERGAAAQTSAGVTAAALIAMCLVVDIGYVTSDKAPDLKKEAGAVLGELNSDSCVVFVSEGLSRFLFLVFQPQLQQRECLNFRHKRAVLAIHPFVSLESRHSATGFFRGLNFTEKKNLNIGGGQIVVMEQAE